MFRKVIEAKIVNSVTGYSDRYEITLECGHRSWQSRNPQFPKPAPKRKNCRDCDRASAEPKPGVEEK
jgi:hypothetical protein